MESVDQKDTPLRHEYKVYRELAKCQTEIVGFCKADRYETSGDYNYMIFDLLGPSLSELYRKCGRKFSLKTGKKFFFEIIFEI